MASYDFALRMTEHAIALYPLTCRAIAALVALRCDESIAFDCYETSFAELIALRAAGFHFC